MYFNSENDKFANQHVVDTRRHSISKTNGVTGEIGEAFIQQYTEWTSSDVVKWILSLNNGLFIQYNDILNETLTEEDISGDDLMNIEKADIKRWGIIKFKHIQILYDHFQQLIIDQVPEGEYNQ